MIPLPTTRAVISQPCTCTGGSYAWPGPCIYPPSRHHAEQTTIAPVWGCKYQTEPVFSFHNYFFGFIYRQGGQIKIQEISPFWRPTCVYKNLRKMGFFWGRYKLESAPSPKQKTTKAIRAMKPSTIATDIPVANFPQKDSRSILSNTLWLGFSPWHDKTCGGSG